MSKSPHERAPLTPLLLSRELVQVLEKHGVTVQLKLCDARGRTLSQRAETALFPELRAAQEKLEHLRRLGVVAALAAGVTHDLRNLLTGSLGFTQILRAKARDAALVQDTARTIETELRRCVALVASFLKLSRSGAEPMMELIMGEVVEPVAQLCAHSLRQRGCTLNVELASGLPKVLGRAADLQRVLINLVLNAADAAPGVHIVLRAESAADGNLQIGVSDDGPGVPPELAERIFEPFFSTKDASQGTGLGLAISRGIAEAHGGKLTLLAAEGRGATFVLELPALRQDGRPVRASEPAS
jgi:signal transduction histidine kinase